MESSGSTAGMVLCNASVSNLPRSLRWFHSPIQEYSHVQNDFHEYVSGLIDERLDLEAAYREAVPDNLDDQWPYAFQVRNE